MPVVCENSRLNKYRLTSNKETHKRFQVFATNMYTVILNNWNTSDNLFIKEAKK